MLEVFNSDLDFHSEWSKFYSEKCSLGKRTLGNIIFLFVLLLKPNFFWTFFWFLVWSWEMSLLNRPQNWILDIFVKFCLPLKDPEICSYRKTYVAFPYFSDPSSLKADWTSKWKKFVEVSSARSLKKGQDLLRRKYRIRTEDEEAYSLELNIPKKRRISRSSSPEVKHRKKKSTVIYVPLTIFIK
jgi:hypothetical protein